MRPRRLHHAPNQLLLDFSAPAATAGTLRTKRRYCRHKLQHVVYIRRNYGDHTRAELAAALGLTTDQVKELCKRHRITKRAPNGMRWCDKPRRNGKPHIPALQQAA